MSAEDYRVADLVMGLKPGFIVTVGHSYRDIA
jgi:hypothetical protein